MKDTRNLAKHVQRFTQWYDEMYEAEEVVERLLDEAQTLDEEREGDGFSMDEVLAEYNNRH